jgi:hypothetical protein
VASPNGASLADLMARIPLLPLNAGQQNSLLAKLRAAQASIARGNRTSAVNQLGAFVNEVQALKSASRCDGGGSHCGGAGGHRVDLSGITAGGCCFTWSR